MILPYNVDRPARLTPTITYVLLGINILVYVLAVGYSNYKMYAEREEQAKFFSTFSSSSPATPTAVFRRSQTVARPRPSAP
jgi:hypothetical protein